MTTKEKILQTTLKLYNERGVAKVSARDICGQLNMSPGNFSYHYPNMARLVTDLYSSLVRETAKIMAFDHSQPISFRYFFELRMKLFEVQYRYKFFYLNLFDILKNFEDVKQLYLMQYEEEQAMEKEFIQKFKALGFFKYDIPSSAYNHIIHVGQVLNNTWLIDAELHHHKSLEEKKVFYLHLCCSRFIPYMTDSAKKEYQDYLKELKANLEKNTLP